MRIVGEDDGNTLVGEEVSCTYSQNAGPGIFFVAVESSRAS